MPRMLRYTSKQIKDLILKALPGNCELVEFGEASTNEQGVTSIMLDVKVNDNFHPGPKVKGRR